MVGCMCGCVCVVCVMDGRGEEMVGCMCVCMCDSWIGSVDWSVCI